MLNKHKQKYKRSHPKLNILNTTSRSDYDLNDDEEKDKIFAAINAVSNEFIKQEEERKELEIKKLNKYKHSKTYVKKHYHNKSSRNRKHCYRNAKTCHVNRRKSPNISELI
jgi:hypothetical protein